MNTHFTSDPRVIEQLTRVLQITSENLDMWTTEFIDPTNQDRWLMIRVNSGYHGGGSPVLLKLPEPTRAELFSIALTSESKDEVTTAAALLENNERDPSFAFRGDLIMALEKHVHNPSFIWNEFERWRIPAIIKGCVLFDPMNRRPTLGKTASEVESDFNYFKDISERARQLTALAAQGKTQ